MSSLAQLTIGSYQRICLFWSVIMVSAISVRKFQNPFQITSNEYIYPTPLLHFPCPKPSLLCFVGSTYRGSERDIGDTASPYIILSILPLVWCLAIPACPLKDKLKHSKIVFQRPVKTYLHKNIMRRQRSSYESSFNHDATSDNLDLNVANEDSDEDADQEIGANPVNQSSSLERNTGLLLRNIRRRTNPITEQDFLNSRLSSTSPVYSSQLFQPSYQNWVTSPSSTSNPANFHFVASNSSYGYQRQENSQYTPGISTMQIAPAGTQLSPSPAFPQQNVTRSFPSSFTNGVHLPSTMRFAGISIDNRGQVGYQIQPSNASSAMRDNIESRFGNAARAFQAPTQQIDVALRTLAPLRALIDVNPTLAPLQALIDVDPERLLRTVRRAFDILVSAGAFVRYEDGRMVHDVNANLRLDIDNMSYEELLALEDHIGNVGSGFSEETILGALKRLTYQPMRLGGPVEEMCCICQEDFVDGEQLGLLDCSHKYHVDCIKQWLLNKNNCPICKATALAV